MRVSLPLPLPSEEIIQFGPLLIVVALAFGVPLVLRRFRRLQVPIVVGEILGGILVGRSGFGWVSPNEGSLQLLAEIGFVFLMFLAGMEIDFSLLGRSRTTSPSAHPLSFAARHYAMTLVISLVLSGGLYALGLVENPWLMGLILSTNSLGVIMPVLKEQHLNGTLFGQTLLLAALVADFATMLLITVQVALISTGLSPEILLIGLLFVAMLTVYYFGDFLFRRIPGVRTLLEELSHATAQIKVRLSFLLMLLFVVLAESLGTEIILGAFLAGLIVSLLRSPEDQELIHQLESMGFGFFIPIFFVMVGVEFNLQAFLGNRQALVLFPLLLIAAAAVKVLPSFWTFRKAFGARSALAGGALLSARLSLIIAASAIGLRLGVINEAVHATIILLALVSVMVAPSAFLALLPKREATVSPPMLVVDADALGLQVAQILRAHGERVLVLDHDAERRTRARKMGLEVASFPPDDPQRLEGAHTLVCAQTDAAGALEVCRWARSVHGIEHVVALVSDPATQTTFEHLGVTTLPGSQGHALMLALMARSPDLIALLTRTDDDREVAEVVLTDPALDGKRLREVSLPGDVLVLSIHRNGDILIPHGDTRLQRGDRLIVAGTLEHVDTFRRTQEERQ